MLLLIVSSLGMENGGGGEWDALRKAEEIVSRGGEVVWASATRAGSFQHAVRHVESAGIRLRTLDAGGVASAVESVRPDVVYAYGDISSDAVRACKALRVPVVVGVHFWTALVRLSPRTSNRQVLENAHEHSAQPWAESLLDAADAVFSSSFYLTYAIQDIMRHTIPRVICSLPHRNSISRVPYSPHRRFVMFGSVHPLKGGAVAVELARKYPAIPLLCLHPEAGSEEVVAQLRGRPRVVLRPNVTPMSSAFASARVCVCAGVVDETFGRVALESAYNGVPLITSMRGNLAALAHAGSEAVDPDHAPSAADAVARMYNASASELCARSAEATRFAERFECSERDGFWDVCAEIRDAAARTVAVFVPWADTGLGKQGKVYVDSLERAGIKTSIFSFCTYDVEKKPWWLRRDQRDPGEWAHARVYYSRNVRENVTSEEVCAFVKAFRVDIAIVPEMCFGSVPITKYLHRMNVRVVSVPNIEFVRASELDEAEKYVDLIATNNYQGFAFFASRMSTVHKTVHLSFPAQRARMERSMADRAARDHSRVHAFARDLFDSRDAITMLLCCGRVGRRRKRALTVTNAFGDHISEQPDSKLRLIVTSQSEEQLGPVCKVDDAHLRIWTNNLTNEELCELRRACDITIIVSNEEGLGMEFFEAMEAAAIMVTHSGHPHRLFATHQITGFVAQADQTPMAHEINPDAVVASNAVQQGSLRDIFDEISRMSRDAIEHTRRAAVQAYARAFSQEAFDDSMHSIVSKLRASL
jgi:glycosyltransferase involved in cell wall biosynthesis